MRRRVQEVLLNLLFARSTSTEAEMILVGDILEFRRLSSLHGLMAVVEVIVYSCSVSPLCPIAFPHADPTWQFLFRDETCTST